MISEDKGEQEWRSWTILEDVNLYKEHWCWGYDGLARSNFIRVDENRLKCTVCNKVWLKNVPKRIQRLRTKGWRMPKNTVYVGRPSKWGSPYTIPIVYGDREEAVRLYVKYLEEMRDLDEFLSPLVGKNLACWCRLDQKCHANELLLIVKTIDHKPAS